MNPKGALNHRDTESAEEKKRTLRRQTRIVAEVERRLSVVEKLETAVNANLQRATRLRQSILQQPPSIVNLAEETFTSGPRAPGKPRRRNARTRKPRLRKQSRQTRSYDRYLADVFIGPLKGESSKLKGQGTDQATAGSDLQISPFNSQPGAVDPAVFLNKALLGGGFAVRYDGGAKEEE